ncbi:MAG: tRNA (adenosine(37)-N6)-threonylcarbamoyltransferase complex dimerization subunit type 1 TsaB [Alphaproteobacteria bacterium]|nr:tRNA (adenosine(37)-N6)-threonylcarbamoyltransferase complex dimerization subunit type 1 TsaB [Alphaproteobacteria bacterium]
MLILSIDTSGFYCSVSLQDEQRVYGVISRFYQIGMAEALVPMIDEVMKKSNKPYAELQSVAVAVGPGSFTGVRVALSSAKALAMALGLPVYGVNNFEVLAYEQKRPLAVVLDTKRADFYVQFFDEKGQASSTPQILTAEDLKNKQEHFFIGDGVQKLKQEIKVKELPFLPEERIVALGKIALARKDNPLKAEPLYLREAYVHV